MKKVKIYSTSWCAFCKQEKAWLNENKIAFEDIMADADQAAAEELQKVSGGLSVPFTIITSDDGQETKILGFDQPKLTAALGL